MSTTAALTRGVARSLEAADRVNGYVTRYGLRRGLELAVRARPGRTERTTMEWPGYPAPFTIRLNGGSDLATFNEVIADECYRLPFDLAPRTIIDAGANIGLTSAYFARLHPEATIVSLEPDTENFELLVQNTAAFPNVHPVRAAIWTSPGTVRLGDPNAGPRGYRVDEEAARGFDVPALDVPAVMEQFGMDHVDLLKIDVESAEVEIFDDSARWIDHVDAIAVELHDRFRPGCARSFFAATTAFPDEWVAGETTFVRRRVDA